MELLKQRNTFKRQKGKKEVEERREGGMERFEGKKE